MYDHSACSLIIDDLRHGFFGLRCEGRARGLRILECFVPNEDFGCIELHLSIPERSLLVSAIGFFATFRGELGRARKAAIYCRRLQADASVWPSSEAIDIADIEILVGHFPRALDYCESKVASYIELSDRPQASFTGALFLTSRWATSPPPTSNALRI